jgi:hypothetical protein
MNAPLIAGTISTIIFATSLLPMLIKARRTGDLASYSLGNILLSNLGNLVHSVYVFSLPAGPIWALHGFYLMSMGLLLLWYLRFKGSTGAALARRTYSGAMAYRSASSGMRDRLAPRQTRRILAAPVAISWSVG